ncbi:MAG: hypothetical protein O3C63_01075 [Cyanobacteria bacterium]|nr:hypothetical protein [Cyanobacteriota bacterium]MDA1021034.1 hypothetical protein [Cyanobacteriota bacterium]
MIIILLLILVQSAAFAYNDSGSLLEQQLKPVIINPMTDTSVQTGRSYNQHPQARVLAPKIKGYPFLDQLEFLIYPGRDFKLENPGKRLERLETAIFGDKQKGPIPVRLSHLQDEITSWQIANAQAMEIVNSDKKQAHVYEEKGVKNRDSRETSISHRSNIQQSPRYSLAPPPYFSPAPLPVKHTSARKLDYDYMNYRMTTPLIQNIAKKTIDLIF